jgi:hypothetical protein
LKWDFLNRRLLRNQNIGKKQKQQKVDSSHDILRAAQEHLETTISTFVAKLYLVNNLISPLKFSDGSTHGSEPGLESNWRVLKQRSDCCCQRLNHNGGNGCRPE